MVRELRVERTGDVGPLHPLVFALVLNEMPLLFCVLSITMPLKLRAAAWLVGFLSGMGLGRRLGVWCDGL